MIIIHTDVWGKSIPGRGNKGVRAEMCLSYSRKIKGIRVVGLKWTRRESNRRWCQRGKVQERNKLSEALSF